MQDAVLDQLSPNTRQTVQRILSGSLTPGATSPTKAVSTAKLEQTWSNLWQRWATIVDEAAQEDGQYMARDEHWEPPDFDQTVFIYDLEQVAKEMRPEAAQKSDYTQHAHWMAALRELAPQSYEVLLNTWRVDHHRRRNLWEAMSRMGLD